LACIRHRKLSCPLEGVLCTCSRPLPSWPYPFQGAAIVIEHVPRGVVDNTQERNRRGKGRPPVRRLRVPQEYRSHPAGGHQIELGRGRQADRHIVRHDLDVQLFCRAMAQTGCRRSLVHHILRRGPVQFVLGYLLDLWIIRFLHHATEEFVPLGTGRRRQKRYRATGGLVVVDHVGDANRRTEPGGQRWQTSPAGA
jgi:hypothetical protein